MKVARLTPVLSAVAGVLTAACVSNPAPHGWLSPAEQAQRDPYGAWIQVTYTTPLDSARAQVAGELIAVDPDTVFVLTPEDALVPVPIERALHGRLGYYDSQSWATGSWAVLGTLSTLSHGIVLIVSAPVWILSGTIATADQSRRPVQTVHGSVHSSWRGLGMYARFPLGMPEGLDRGRLRGKRLGAGS